VQWPHPAALSIDAAARQPQSLCLCLSVCVQIVPMENVAGRDLVEAGNLCERKNGRGVDPNRNWDIDWGVKEKDYDPKEEYPGRAALRYMADGAGGPTQR